jgi:hypothetical protein
MSTKYYKAGKINRRDVIIKSTLRKIRKFYLLKFKECTDYNIRRKRYTEAEFFLLCNR